MNEERKNRGRGKGLPRGISLNKGIGFRPGGTKPRLNMASSPYFKGQLLPAGYLLTSGYGSDGISTVMGSVLATRHGGQNLFSILEVVVTKSGTTSLEDGLWDDETDVIIF